MHLRLPLFIVALFAALFVCGCATPEYQGQDFGTVVASVAMNDGSGNLALSFRPQGSKRDIEIGYNAADVRPGIFSDGAIKGIARAVKLPPGAYEIYAFHLDYNGLDLAYTTPAFTPIPFVVETGKVTYVGSYLAWLKVALPEQAATTSTSNGTVVSMPFTAMRFVVEPLDEHVRDLAKIAETDPLIGTSVLRIAVPVERVPLTFPFK